MEPADSSDRTLSIWDFRIPWRPLYDALYEELFPHPSRLNRHSFNLAPTFLNVAETAQRFFHPADMDEMLEVMLPKFEPNMDSILSTQAFLVHFLPISHPQRWLPLSKLIPSRGGYQADSQSFACGADSTAVSGTTKRPISSASSPSRTTTRASRTRR